jgi:hypothetical protein
MGIRSSLASEGQAVVALHAINGGHGSNAGTHAQADMQKASSSA